MNTFLLKSLLSSVVLLLALVSVSFSQSQNVIISKAPVWVKSVKTDLEATTIDDNNGYYYLLIDRQENVAKSTYYGHVAIKIINNEGIQNMSDISLDFDPSYQKLKFHTVQVVRDGKAINKLKRSDIKTFQREASMDRHLYDGRISAVINLTDVRIGDVVEYSYSKVGYNPVSEGHFSDKMYFEFSLPVHRIYHNLIIPKSQKVQFKYFNNAQKATENDQGEAIAYSWDISPIDALLIDNNYPGWYDPYKYVMVTDYVSWKGVVDWALKNYTLSERDKAKLKDKVKAQFDIANKKEAVTDIIRFVQDEIRYLGFESGLNSQKPHSPESVFEQRFGDCKDKSFLLSSALQSIGVESYPVLVNSNSAKAIMDELPAPGVFNHCIVKVNYEGSAYFIDPTINNQGGEIDNYYFPNYHGGLVIKEGVSALEEFPELVPSKTEVVETFIIDKVGEPAKLLITSSYFGGNADSQRSYFSSSSLKSVKKNYENYYSNLYPDISATKDVEFEDFREENKFVVKEEYLINDFWNPNPEDEEQLYCEVYPLAMDSYVNVNYSKNRDAPFYLTKDLNYDYITHIELPEPWTVKNDHIEVKSKDYSYVNDISYEDQVITIQHHYETYNDHITADLMGKYVDDHNKIVSNLSYNLTYGGTASASGGWSWAAYVLLILLVSGVIGFWLIRKLYLYDVPSVPYEDVGKQIGGWLVLPALGLSITPFRLLYDIFSTPEYFDASTWQTVWDYYGPGMFFYSSFELIFNFLFLVFSVLLVILFFSRRSNVRSYATTFYAINLAVAIISYIIMDVIFTDIYTAADVYESGKDILRAAFTALIWIPYFNLSERAKETFVVKLDKNVEESEGLSEERSFTSY